MTQQLNIFDFEPKEQALSPPNDNLLLRSEVSNKKIAQNLAESIEPLPWEPGGVDYYRFGYDRHE